LVHAIDETAKSFYKKFGFAESGIDEMTLMTRICDIRAAQTLLSLNHTDNLLAQLSWVTKLNIRNSCYNN
jgi:hypothetical protein